MNRYDRPPPAASGLLVCLGLLVSQAAATWLVHRANLDLQAAMTAIMARGYVAVPSPGVAADLARWTSSFMGAIFFTLTAGSLIVFATLAALGLAQRFFPSTAKRAVLLAVLGATLAVFLNLRGMNPGATLYSLAVMAAVAVPGLAMGGNPGPGKGGFSRKLLIIGPLVLLAGIWLMRLDRDLFVDIRDRLLFSNPPGVKIVDFYYDYNLFAVQAIAPLNHRTLIGIDLSAIKENPAYRDLADVLGRNDMLDVGRSPGAAIVVQPGGAALRWQDRAGRGFEVDEKEILDAPRSVVDRFSQAVDVKAPFRRLTLAGILVGFPVLLYLIVFTAAEKVLAFFLGPRAAWGAALICLVVGAALFYPLARVPSEKDRTAGVDAALWRNGSVSDRVFMLRQTASRRIDPLVYPQIESAARSPWLAERYWFALALANARTAKGFALASNMTRDQSPIVACKACYALGEMGDKKAVSLLLETIHERDHWYVQRYAYTALRKLGWTQPALFR